MIDAADLDEAIVNAANPGGIRTGQLPTSSEGAERRIRLTVKRVLCELPADVTVGELLELLE